MLFQTKYIRFMQRLSTMGQQMSASSQSTFSTTSANVDSSKNKVVFEESGIVVTAPSPFVRRVLLNRPKTLNALDISMIRALQSQITPWEQQGVRAVLVAGEGGKAFCAGGDVKAVYEAKKSGDKKVPQDFFREEYTLDYSLSQMKATQISILDGIVMGGGVGISIHSPIRIATENTLFAMPEAKLGLFTDVGAGYFLSRLRKNLGLFLALTGQRIKGKELVQVGLADYYVPRERLAQLEAQVVQSVTKDSSTQSLRQVIVPFADTVEQKYENEDEIDKIYGAASYKQIVQNLESAGNEFSKKQLELLSQQNAISLRVIFEQIRRGAKLDLRENFILEYRLSQHFMDGNDFFEGVRTVLIDRKDKPKWTYKSAAEVPDAEVESYFEPLQSPKSELKL